jgi:phage terminase small subunit
MVRAFINKTRNITPTTKNPIVKDFIEENEGRLQMLNSNFTFKPSKKQQKKEESKENEEDEKNEEEKSENDEK